MGTGVRGRWERLRRIPVPTLSFAVKIPWAGSGGVYCFVLCEVLSCASGHAISQDVHELSSSETLSGFNSLQDHINPVGFATIGC